MRYLLERPEAHYTDNYAVSEEKARLNKTVFRLRLKEVVDRCDLRSVGTAWLVQFVGFNALVSTLTDTYNNYNDDDDDKS